MATLRNVLLAALALLLSVGSASGEKIKFQNGQLVTDFLGANPCTTTTYGSNPGDLGMVTISATGTKIDSVRGKCELRPNLPGKHHFIGKSAAERGGTGQSMILIRLDVRALVPGAIVRDASLFLPVISNSLRSSFTEDFSCAPVMSTRPWRYPTIGPVDSTYSGYVHANTDTLPCWRAWRETLTDTTYWSRASGDSIRGWGKSSVHADRWPAVSSFHCTPGWTVAEFKVTSAFTLEQADSSVDISNCGFRIWVTDPARVATTQNYAKFGDHFCPNAAYRPYMIVDYVDTSHVNTLPLRLGGRDGISVPKSYHDTIIRDTTGRIVWIADPHISAGGTPATRWRLLRVTLNNALAMSPRPTAVFCGGDWAANDSSPAGWVDSLRLVQTAFADAGMPLYSVLGNWDANADSTSIPRFSRAQSMLPLPGQSYYDLDLGFARFWMINAMTGWDDGNTVHNASQGAPGDNLTDRNSTQWWWLKNGLANARDGQPQVIVSHTPILGAFPAWRKNLRDYLPGPADSLAAMCQRGGARLWLSGHQHSYTCTNPIVFDLPNDTLYARPAFGTDVKIAEGDSAVIYLTCNLAQVTAVLPNSTIISNGWVRRWYRNGYLLGDPHDPPMTTVDFLGNWMRIATQDTAGVAEDTLLVRY